MPTPRPQRGASLIEGLVALAVLSLSLVGAAQLQAALRQHGELARERSAAVQHAQHVLDARRGFHDLTGFDTPPAPPAAAPYTVTQRDAVHDGLRTERVSVSWQHRGAGPQSLQLTSGVARLAPVYTGLLEIAPQDTVLATQRILPTRAHPLPAGRSIVRPSEASPVAWIVDDASGEIVQQCRVALGAPAGELRLDDLTDCEPAPARLVRGYVRFALSSTPDPLQAHDTPLPLRLRAGGLACESEVIMLGGERYVAYACATNAVEPVLEPQGWAFGLTASTYKACRYPGGRHAPRNYLVVRGDLDCPSGVTPHNGAPVVTVQHQP